jgi:hypothetical protein
MVVTMTSSTAVEANATPMNLLLLGSKTVEENCNCGETSVIVSTSSEATTDSVSSHDATSPQARRDSSNDTPAANPAQDENVRILLAQLYQSSARSRKLNRPSSSLASRSSSSSSTSQQEQQIWTEMKNAISSIEEWKFIHHHSNNSSYSTNSLSSMVSNNDDDDMSCNAVTAEELFDDDFFERH